MWIITPSPAPSPYMYFLPNSWPTKVRITLHCILDHPAASYLIHKGRTKTLVKQEIFSRSKQRKLIGKQRTEMRERLYNRIRRDVGVDEEGRGMNLVLDLLLDTIKGRGGIKQILINWMIHICQPSFRQVLGVTSMIFSSAYWIIYSPWVCQGGE